MRASFFIPALLLCFYAAGAQANAQNTSSVTGTVANASSQGPISGATVELMGPGVDRKTTSDAHGTFAFEGLSAGIYSVRTTATGYAVAVSPPFAIGAGEHVQLAVAMQPQSSTALKTIASVRINGKQAVSASSAPTVTITNREYVAKGQVLVQQALQQTPGVTVEHYNGGLGSVAVLTIRGAGAFSEGQYANTGYEVLVLQDGEPLRNGQYGDFDLSTLTPAIYSRTEVLKGVGGTSLFGANTIGGTLNLVTRDPLKTEGGEFLATAGGFGFTDFNVSETNTIGKFGYVLDVHRMTSEGPIPGNLFGDYANYCGFTTQANGTCFIAHPTQNFDLKSALAKLRYQASPVTSVTFTGTFESDMRDQNGLQGNPTTVNGASTDSRGIPFFFGFPVDNVYNIQPKYALDVHTQAGGGDLILRTYAQLLERVDGDIAALPATPLDNPPFPGATIENLNQYEDRAVDRLYGTEAYWTRIFGRHTLTLAAGANGDSFFEWGGAIPQPMTFSQLPLIVQGKQIERTYMVRDQIEASPRWRFDFAGYYSSYDTLNTKRFDPRLGVVFRPDLSSAVHFSVASGFAAPRIRDINLGLDMNIADAGYDPRCGNINGGNCAASVGNRNLLPENAIGYDLGYQHNFTSDGRGFVDLDFYRTNLFHHIINADLPAPPGLTFSDGTTPIKFFNTPLNLSRAVYTGFEFTGSLPVSRNFALTGDYDTQAAYPLGIDVNTETIAQTLVNNQQFLGVPVHKFGYGVNYENRAGTSAFFEGHYNGINNPFNVASFWIYNAGITTPLGENALHITWQNIFNKNAGIWSFFGAGVPYPGFSGDFATNTHPSYPHSINVTFERRWGSLRNP